MQLRGQEEEEERLLLQKSRPRGGMELAQLGSPPTHSFSNLIGSSLTMSCPLIGRALETWAESAASSGFVSPSGRISPRRHKRISPADQQDLRNSELGVWYGKASNPKFKSFLSQHREICPPTLTFSSYNNLKWPCLI